MVFIPLSDINMWMKCFRSFTIPSFGTFWKQWELTRLHVIELTTFDIGAMMLPISDWRTKATALSMESKVTRIEDL